MTDEIDIENPEGGPRRPSRVTAADVAHAAGKSPLVLSGTDTVTDRTVMPVLKYLLDALIVRGGSVTPEVIET